MRRNGQLEEGRLQRLTLPPAATRLSTLLDEKDLILVTGGARGVAARVVRRLLTKVSSRFLLIGRQVRSEPWIEDEGGGRVEYLAADLLDPAAVAALDLRSRPVTLLIHAAGIEYSRKIRNINRSEIDQVLGTKVLGLEHVLADLSVEHLRGLVSFSSVAAAFGGFGQPDYAAANGFLDGFSWRQTPSLSLGWTAWAEVGMAAREPTRSFLAAIGVESLNPETGTDVFERLLENWLRSPAAGPTHLVVRGAMPASAFLPRDPTVREAE